MSKHDLIWIIAAGVAFGYIGGRAMWGLVAAISEETLRLWRGR